MKRHIRTGGNPIALLNYSTTVSVEKTIGEIMLKLGKAGAKSIQTDYEGGEPIALNFLIPTAFGERSFRLPANVAAVRAILKRDYNAGKVQLKQTSQEHAARVSWRIIKDWLEAQLALIEAGQATLDQVFLPYALLPSGSTVYEALTTSHFKLLDAHRETGSR